MPRDLVTVVHSTFPVLSLPLPGPLGSLSVAGTAFAATVHPAAKNATNNPLVWVSLNQGIDWLPVDDDSLSVSDSGGRLYATAVLGAGGVTSWSILELDHSNGDINVWTNADPTPTGFSLTATITSGATAISAAVLPGGEGFIIARATGGGSNWDWDIEHYDVVGGFLATIDSDTSDSAPRYVVGASPDGGAVFTTGDPIAYAAGNYDTVHHSGGTTSITGSLFGSPGIIPGQFIAQRGDGTMHFSDDAWDTFTTQSLPNAPVGPNPPFTDARTDSLFHEQDGESYYSEDAGATWIGPFDDPQGVNDAGTIIAHAFADPTSGNPLLGGALFIVGSQVIFQRSVPGLPPDAEDIETLPAEPSPTFPSTEVTLRAIITRTQ